jgi:hypothetical protein
LVGSGARNVEKTFTTEFSTDFEGVTACELCVPAVASGDGGGETGSATAISGNAGKMRRRKRNDMELDISASVLEFISSKLFCASDR